VKAVFADTFYWIALTVPTEAAHQQANRFSARIVTTDEVLSEYLTFFSGSPDFLRQEASMVVFDILQDPGIRVIPQSRATFLAGLDLYRARPDKGYSLIDCISMHTMRREGLTDVLTNDRHFEQEGFRALFRSLARG
jgi:predicted nucleic acid-binding protein